MVFIQCKCELRKQTFCIENLLEELFRHAKILQPNHERVSLYEQRPMCKHEWALIAVQAKSLIAPFEKETWMSTMNTDFETEKEKSTRVLCKLLSCSLFSCVGCYHCQLRFTDQLAELPIILFALKLAFRNILHCHCNCKDCFVSWLWFSLKVFSYI